MAHMSLGFNGLGSAGHFGFSGLVQVGSGACQSTLPKRALYTLAFYFVQETLAVGVG